MKKVSLDEFLRLRRLVYRSARPLDYTKWKFLFENGSCDDFLLVLSGYQNEDGGFGYNIECNNWNPKNSMKYAYPAIFTFDKEEGCCYVNFPDINTICKSCYR